MASCTLLPWIWNLVTSLHLIYRPSILAIHASHGRKFIGLARNAAVVGKRTTAVYAEVCGNHLFKCLKVTKIGQGHLKLLLVQRLH